MSLKSQIKKLQHHDDKKVAIKYEGKLPEQSDEAANVAVANEQASIPSEAPASEGNQSSESSEPAKSEPAKASKVNSPAKSEQKPESDQPWKYHKFK